MIEPVQGEGGIVVPAPGYLESVRELCDRHDLLLILDEVQTGMGRTGKLFAHEYGAARPDVMTLAKGLGAGVPIGAMLGTERLVTAFAAGAHGSTFGGNALACNAAGAVLDALLDDAVLDNCAQRGEELRARLRDLQRRCSRIKDVRGLGLLVGAQLDGPGAAVVDACLERGLLINCTAGSVLRFSPPLVVSTEEVERAVQIVEDVLRS